jgi:hypothetical protein
MNHVKRNRAGGLPPSQEENKMEATNTLAKLLADGAMKTVAALLAHEPETMLQFTALGDARYARLTAALHDAFIKLLPEFEASWKSALDAYLSEGWLRELVKTQCFDAACTALDSLNLRSAKGE